jgi:gliding motility-associated-like protein
MKNISTTLDFYISRRSLSKSLLIALVCVLPFLSLGQQGTLIQLPESYTYFGGDSLQGFDFHGTYAKAVAGNYQGVELNSYMRGQERLFVYAKYHKNFKYGIKQTDPLHTLSRFSDANGHVVTGKQVIADKNNANKANELKAKHFDEARNFYKNYKKPMSSGCANLDLGDGDFTNWSGEYAENGYDYYGAGYIVYYAGPPPPGNPNWTFNSTQLNAQEAAPPASNQTPITKGLNSNVWSCSWVTLLNSSAGNDPCGGFPVVCPYGGFTESLRLGGANVNAGAGYSSNPAACGKGATNGTGTDDDNFGGGSYYTGQGEYMQDSILITSSNCMITINFAAVLNDGGHPAGEQPWIGFQMVDGSGNGVPCLNYYQEAVANSYPPGYSKGTRISKIASYTNTDCYYIGWTPIAFDCSAYIGKYLTLQLFAVGCEAGAHFAYAYFDVSCGPLSLPVTNPSCGNGTITAPPGAATYQWTTAGGCLSGVTTNQTATVTCSGTYSCTINLNGTDPSCNYTIDTTITINSNPTVTANATSATICSGTGGTTLNAGGAGAGATYTWTPGGMTGSSVSVNPGVGTTTYTVTGKTAGLGCTGTATVSVTVNSTPTVTSISITPSPTVCAGTPTTLSANGAATSYAWTGSSATVPTTGATVVATPTVTSTYTVVATTGSCSSAPASTTITVNPNPTVTASATSTTICQGQSTKLSASPSGLSSYAWTFAPPPGNLTNTIYDTTTASPTVTTVYTVIATDGNGCSNSSSPATVTVTVNTTPTVSVGAVPSKSICSGTPVTLTASGANTYSWNTTPVQTTAAITVTPLVTTTYVVTGSSAALCSGKTSIDTVIVLVTTTPTVTVNSPGICPGGTATLTANGATTYVWSTGSTTDTIMPTPAGTQSYTVTGTNSGPGAVCTSSATSTVTVGTLTVTIKSAHHDTLCSGVPDTLYANGASTYTWSNGATATYIVVSPPTGNTNYWVVGTSGSGCSDTGKVTITVNTTPTITVSANDSASTVCPGDTTQAHVIITGGTGPFVYSWATTTTPQTHDTAYGLGAGTYTVSITDSNKCTSASVNYTITTQNIVVTATASGGGNICTGGSPTLLTATGANNYVWHTSPGLSDTIYDTATAFPSATTTYTVMGTTKGTCKDSATVTVTVNATPTLTLNLNNKDTAVCTGGSITVKAGGASSYTWSSSPAGAVSPTTGSTVVVTPTSATTVIVTGTGAGGCSINDTILVGVVPSPTVNIKVTGGNDTICVGKSVTLTATGAPGNTYLWSPGGSTNASVKVTPATSPTTYTVESTNGGCSVKTTQDVYIFPTLGINMLPVANGCSGQLVTIGASPVGGNPLPGYTYSWSPNSAGGVSLTGPGPFSIPSAAQTFTCTITDGCGNTATGTTQVTVSPSPVAKFTPMPADSILAGGYMSFVDSSTNASKWYWTFGDGGTSVDSFPYYQYNAAGNYTVTLLVISPAGCRDSISEKVIVKEWIFIPNVFTPNGDGINDVFHVTAASVKSYHIEIFNRWGEQVFTADDPNIDWNGRSESGVRESDGIYYYKLLATDYAGKTYNLDGYVQIIGSAGQ